MMSLFLVMAGGAIGAGLRYLVGTALAGATFPLGTLSVNLVGGFAMGLLVGWLVRHATGEPIRLLLGVGVLGGFTTFSAFSLDVVTMIERGAWGLALGYALVSVVGAVLALFGGLALMRVTA